MDFATILGLLLAFGAIVVAAWVGGSDPHIILHRWDALLLIIGGTIGATLTSFPLRTFARGFLGGVKTAFFEPKYHEANAIATLVSFAEKARREGLLALEGEAAVLEDDFMRKGIQLVIDGRDTEVIRRILETEAGHVQERGAKAEAIFTSLGGYSPTLGIIGTVLGLIGMLRGLANIGSSTNITETIGVATAQAFVATFFGILFANLVWLPIASKIKERYARQMLVLEIMIEGILSIQAGDNPRLLEERLHAFLDPYARESEIVEGGAVAEPSYST